MTSHLCYNDAECKDKLKADLSCFLLLASIMMAGCNGLTREPGFGNWFSAMSHGQFNETE